MGREVIGTPVGRPTRAIRCSGLFANGVLRVSGYCVATWTLTHRGESEDSHLTVLLALVVIMILLKNFPSHYITDSKTFIKNNKPLNDVYCAVTPTTECSDLHSDGGRMSTPAYHGEYASREVGN